MFKVNIYFKYQSIAQNRSFTMSLKDTFKQLRELLANITTDLEKSENGNKAASQRVRTGTVKLEKIAKLYRKESISSEKKNKGQKKPVAKKTAAPSKGKAAPIKGKAPAPKGKTSAPVAKSKGATVKATPKPKTATKASTNVRPRQLSVRKPTAKLPSKKR